MANVLKALPIHKAELGKGFFPDQYLSIVTYRAIEPRDHAPGVQEACPYFEYLWDAKCWLKKMGARMPGYCCPETHRKAVSIWTDNLDDDTPVYVYNELGEDIEPWFLVDNIDKDRQGDMLDIWLANGKCISNVVSGVVYVKSEGKTSESFTYMRKHAKLKAEVMLAYADGKAIQCCSRTLPPQKWEDVLEPTWDWSTMNYGIKAEHAEENKLRTIVCVVNKYGTLLPRIVYADVESYVKSLNDNYPEYAPHTSVEFVEKT